MFLWWVPTTTTTEAAKSTPQQQDQQQHPPGPCCGLCSSTSLRPQTFRDAVRTFERGIAAKMGGRELRFILNLEVRYSGRATYPVDAPALLLCTVGHGRALACMDGRWPAWAWACGLQA